MAVSMKVAVLWVVVPCSLVEVYHHFRGACCHHHQGDKPFPFMKVASGPYCELLILDKIKITIKILFCFDTIKVIFLLPFDEILTQNPSGFQGRIGSMNNVCPLCPLFIDAGCGSN
jgi:hypothetical protein